MLVLNLDRQTICALKACTQYIAAGATFRASGTGTARLYIQFFQSNDGKNQGGSAANATSKEFTIPSDSPYNYSTSMPISQACARDANGAYYYSIVKAWMVVGGRTVMSDTKSIYCGIIVE